MVGKSAANMYVRRMRSGQDWLYLQSAHGENGDQSNLLLTAKIQASNNRYGQNNNCKVCDDVDSGVSTV